MDDHKIDILPNRSQQTAKDDDQVGPDTRSMISVIPNHLRTENMRAYEPRVVSLGPFHKLGKPQLAKFESLKKKLYDMHVKRASPFTELVEYCTTHNPFSEIQRWYDQMESPANDDELCLVISSDGGVSKCPADSKELCSMIARDGLFLLEFLRELSSRPDCQGFHCGCSHEDISSHIPNCNSSNLSHCCGTHKKSISHKPDCKASSLIQAIMLHSVAIKEDVMKLENQIPIFALQRILDWKAEADISSQEMVIEEHNRQGMTRPCRSCRDQPNLNSILRNACRILSPFQHMCDWHDSHVSVGLKQNSHILEFLYENIIHSSLSTYRIERNRMSKKNRDFSLPSAIELDKKGVKFAAQKGLHNNIRFEGRTFHLPRIEMNDSTDAIVSNLVAFEAITKKTKPVRRYVDLMSSLINTAADVEVLRKFGIICSHLGTDQDVASFWNRMKKGLGQNDVYEQTDIAIEDVISFYNSTYRTMWVEFKQTYFSKPWLTVALIGGCLSLLLTVFQTILAWEQVRQQVSSPYKG